MAPAVNGNGGGGGNGKSTPALVVGLEAVGALVLTVYAIFGIVYLCRDQDVVSSCHASNQKVHVIWPTDLWVYVLTSVVVACVGALWLVVAAVMRRPASSTMWEDSEPLDWRLLWGGFTLSGMGILMAVIGYWGYAEVYLANPWCDDKAVVWEELDLTQFGRVTAWLQLVAAFCFISGGWLCWSFPFVLELKRMLASEGGSGSAGDTARGSRAAPGRGNPARGKHAQHHRESA